MKISVIPAPLLSWESLTCNTYHVKPRRNMDPLTACLIKVLSSWGVLDRKSLRSSSLRVPKASSEGTKMVHGPGSDIRTPRKEEEPNAARAFPNFLRRERWFIWGNIGWHFKDWGPLRMEEGNHMHKLPFSNDACHSASDLFAGQCTFARDARMVSSRCGSYCTPSTQEMSYNAFPSIN